VRLRLPARLKILGFPLTDKMKKLVCKIIGGDSILDLLKGLIVTVTEIDQDCPLYVSCIFNPNDLPTNLPCHLNELLIKGKLDSINVDYLEPMDISDVPETHNKNPVLINAWVFVEARNDAWYRDEPSDKEKYKEFFGVEWEDIRVWDVGRG